MEKADKLLEDEVNLELAATQITPPEVRTEEVESSQSEFVEGTQFEKNFNEDYDGNNEMQCNDDITEDMLNEQGRLTELERKNKAFLDQSWANITKNKEAEARLLKEIEADDFEQSGNSADFQVVDRSKKKLIKKSLIKSGYVTRFKSGNFKPFR